MIVEHKFFIGTQYVDKDLKLKNSSLLCMFEDMAGMHGIIAGEKSSVMRQQMGVDGLQGRIVKNPGIRRSCQVRLGREKQ